METQPIEQPNKKAEYDLKRQEKMKVQEKGARSRSAKNTATILGALIVVGGVIGGLVWYMAAHPSAPRTNREVALACTTDMATQFHIHPNLTIIVNGQQAPIPENLGVRPACMTSIHTHHEKDGTLHVEAPERRDFTLGDFFAVWEQPFSKDEILSYKVDGTHQIRVTVNGKEVDIFENTVMRDKNRISIVYEPR